MPPLIHGSQSTRVFGLSREISRVEREIRPLIRGDLNALVALEREVFGGDAWSEDLLAGEIDSPWTTYLGVFEEEGLVAYGGIKGDIEGDLMTIGVLPEKRGAGIGRLLLKKLIEAAKERNMGQLFLEVRASNEAARRLYQSEGFEELGKVPSYYRHPNEDAVTMRLELGTGTLA